jgi:excisionase family DNA binding protein
MAKKIQQSQLDRVEKAVILASFTAKNVLTFDEAAEYSGVSKSHLYKLTMLRSIPHYKPRGKMVYFDRTELDSWLLQNRVSTSDELEAKASTYVTLNKQ